MGRFIRKLNIYEVTFNRLQEKGFLQEKESVVSHLGVALFRKGNINIIIQNLDKGMKIDDIKQESIRIREKLHQIQINVWNTYYILCADEEIVEGEDLFFIERDSSGLRKYVVKEEEDLNRILFLDNQPVNKINNPIQIKDKIPENDETVKIIFKFIEDNGGTEKIIPDKDIDNLIDKIL
jgi:hypothetical protein